MVETMRSRRLYKGYASGGLVDDSSSASMSINQIPARVGAMLNGTPAAAPSVPAAPTSTTAQAAAAAPGAMPATEPRGGAEGVEPAAHESSGNTSEGLGHEAVEGNPGGAAVNYNKGGPVKSVRGPPVGKDDGIIAAQKGEFVVRKSAVKKLGEAALNEINAGRMPHGLYGRKTVGRAA